VGNTYDLDDRSQLHKQANEALDENLAPDERVRVVVRGSFNSALIATDRRVFMFKMGAESGALMGTKLTSYSYDKLSGCSFETGVLTGRVSLDGPWGRERGKRHDPAHGLALARRHFKQARQGAIALGQLIAKQQMGLHTRLTDPAP
jgi:hypothetical protein